MDIIDRAISDNKHLCKNTIIQQQTWEQFENSCKGRKLFIFGIGGGTYWFWIRYGGKMLIEGVIDNSPVKQVHQLGDYVLESLETKDSKLCISGIDILKQYDADEIVVLITSTNYYMDMIAQLESLGVCHAYVMLIMEANRRIPLGETGLDLSQRVQKLPISKKKIVFWAFARYTDHGKYITEALLRCRNDLDIVWLVNDLDIDVPDGVRLVNVAISSKYIYEMETASIWVFNAPVPDNIVKKQGQVYIQTKHWASVTLKKFYLDSKTITDIPEDVAYWKRDSQKIDYITTGSDFDTESSRRGFDFHKDVVQIGSPRSDAMFMKEKYKKKVCCAFGLDMSTRILLYAPTYRYQKGKAVHLGEVRDVDLDYDAVRNMLESRFGGEWCIMLRLHPGNEKEIEKLKLPDYVIDASMYSDGQEIVSACDILVSDYSSIMFEPAFVKKPVFLFATDRKDYIDKEYDLLIDYDTLPFPIAESNQELVRNIVNFDRAKYEKKLDDFMDRYGVHEDGHASERAAEFISGLIDGQ